MKILHIVNETPAKNVLDLIELQRKAHDVEVININVEQPDYDAIIDQVINSDRVISWSNVHEIAR